MATIIPRWEWRTFGDRFGGAGDRLAALSPGRVQESDELYVVSVQSDASVKIRDGLMDVKHLEEVNGDGLERWRPVMKAAFPLPAADLAAVLATLRVPALSLARSMYTLDELLAEVVRPREDLRAVEVHKKRRHYTLGGCMTELTEMRADQRTTRTIAVESEDPARVIATVHELGLPSTPNVCVARGLKALV